MLVVQVVAAGSLWGSGLPRVWGFGRNALVDGWEVGGLTGSWRGDRGVVGFGWSEPLVERPMRSSRGNLTERRVVAHFRTVLRAPCRTRQSKLGGRGSQVQILSLRPLILLVGKKLRRRRISVRRAGASPDYHLTRQTRIHGLSVAPPRNELRSLNR